MRIFIGFEISKFNNYDEFIIRKAAVRLYVRV